MLLRARLLPIVRSVVALRCHPVEQGVKMLRSVIIQSGSVREGKLSKRKIGGFEADLKIFRVLVGHACVVIMSSSSGRDQRGWEANARTLT